MTKFKLFISIVLGCCMVMAGAIFATACSEEDKSETGNNEQSGQNNGGQNNGGQEGGNETKTPETKAEWQAHYATYTYSDFAKLTYDDWNAKTLVYQFTSLESAFTKGDEIAAEDLDGYSEDAYFAVQAGPAGPGEEPDYNYYEKDYSIMEDGIFMGPGGQAAHVLLNFYDDYSVLILQASLFNAEGDWYDEDNYIWTASYGIWDLKSDMTGSASLKLYYLTKDAAADTTTEVNDSLESLAGRYAVEMHETSNGSGSFWIEPSDFRPLVLFQYSGDVHNSDAYIISVSTIKFASISDFTKVIVDNSVNYPTI